MIGICAKSGFVNLYCCAKTLHGLFKQTGQCLRPAQAQQSVCLPYPKSRVRFTSRQILNNAYCRLAIFDGTSVRAVHLFIICSCDQGLRPTGIRQALTEAKQIADHVLGLAFSAHVQIHAAESLIDDEQFLQPVSTNGAARFERFRELNYLLRQFHSLLATPEITSQASSRLTQAVVS